MPLSLLGLLQQEDRAVKDVDATKEVIDIYLREWSASKNLKDAALIEELIASEYETLTEREEKLSESRKAIRQYLSQL